MPLGEASEALEAVPRRGEAMVELPARADAAAVVRKLAEAGIEACVANGGGGGNTLTEPS